MQQSAEIWLFMEDSVFVLSYDWQVHITVCLNQLYEAK